MTEENNIKIGFFKKMLLSIKDFEAYILFASEETKKVMGYFFKLIAIFAVITSLVFTYKFNNTLTKVKEYFINEMPDFSYENGILEVKSENPIINENTDEVVKIIIIDTLANEEKENEYINKISQYDSGIILLKDRVIFKNSVVQNNIEYRYSTIAKMYNINNFSKEQVINLANNINMSVFYSSFYVSVFVYVFIIYSFSSILDVLLLSILAFLISRLVRIKLKFRPCFNMSIHALTLPIILNCIYIIINNLTGFTIQYFNWMYTTISYIYIIVAILIIKTDTISKQMELLKIIEEQEKVRNEMNSREEQKPKEEEKEENKGNKKEPQDKKEDKNIPDEPEGSNA